VPLKVRPITSPAFVRGEPVAEPTVTDLVPPSIEHAVRHHVRLTRIATRKYTEAADIVAPCASVERHEVESHDARSLSEVSLPTVIT
jgi:hypothetical protein